MSKDFSKPIRVQIFLEEDCLLDKVFQSGPLVFGRESGSDVVLKFSFISKKHFELVELNGSFYIRDLKSHNGIRHQGRQQKVIPLTSEATISVSQLRVKFDLQITPTALNKISEQGADKTEIWTPPQAGNAATALMTSSSAEDTYIPAEPSSAEVTQIMHEMESAIIRVPSEGEAILSGDYTSELVTCHPQVLRTTNRKLEAILLWNKQVYNVHEFSPSRRILIGASPLADIQIPHLNKGWKLAKVDFQASDCFVPKGLNVTLTEANQNIAGNFKNVSGGQAFRLSVTQVAKIDLGSNLELYLRYIPAAAVLEERKILEPDEAVKKALIGSAIFHILLALIIFMTAPMKKPAPQIKNVPERYARLLLEPKPQEILPTPTTAAPEPTTAPMPEPVVVQPTPPPTLPPRKQPIKKVEVKKPEVKKPIDKPKPVVEKKTPVTQPPLAETNKNAGGNKAPEQQTAKGNYQPPPQEVIKPEPTPPPVNLNTLGALGALGSLPSSGKTSAVPSKIQIAKQGTQEGQAGAAGATTGVLQVGLSNGKGSLVATGSSGVKTQGNGAGLGTEYGTQGLKGAAGNRAVGASVIGAPQLNTAGGGRPEGLTRDQVMSEVQKHMVEIQRCYERSLISNPGLSGRMEFEWDIEPQGNVSAARVKKSSVQNGENLGECVRQIFVQMKFPKAKNGQSTQPNIGFPFGRL